MANSRPKWTCEICSKPINSRISTKTGGGIIFDLDEWNDYQRAVRDWEAQNPDEIHTAADIIKRPEAVHWHPRHYDCATDIDPYYDIEISRIATWQAVAQWGSHMLEKDWFPDTNWDDLLDAAGVYDKSF